VDHGGWKGKRLGVGAHGVVNIVKNGKLIDTVSAERAHGMGVDTEGSIYVSGASRMTVMKIVK
jgi:hypothetical protein